LDAHVVNDDRDPPPMHFGEYPHGAYWSAERSDTTDEDGADDDYTVSGQVIRLMWDYGVIVPLWDAEGLLPEEPDWLRAALGLSDPLIDALTRWGHDMNELDASGPMPEYQYKALRKALDVRARNLAVLLQDELGSRFTVAYRPW
jgi:hypothetical protein